MGRGAQLASEWQRESWLGGGDSNPDTQIQSLLTYFILLARNLPHTRNTPIFR